MLAILSGKTSQSDNPKIYISEPLRNLGYDLDIVGLGTSQNVKTILSTLLMPLQWQNYELIIGVGYYVTLALSVKRWLARAKTPILSLGLNQSSRLFCTNIPFIDKVINYFFNQINTAIVHSQHERHLFTQIHQMNPSRLIFSHWGYDLPTIKCTRFSHREEPYFCMIGRNNRDFSTFCQALTRIGGKGIIITSQSFLKDIPETPKVEVFVDLTMDECLDCIRGSLANVILLNDDERGAGHITAVSGMHLGRPTIYSRSNSLADYINENRHGYAVPLKDVAAVASAMRHVVERPDDSRRRGENARDYSTRWLTNQRAAQMHAKIATDVAMGRPVPILDPEWQSHGDVSA